MPILPNRDELRVEFDAAVQELIDKNRTNPLLTSKWYSQIGDSVFDACYRALGDVCEVKVTKRGFPGTPHAPSAARLHVVSAPVGAGKTSFSEAFIVALVKLSERDPNHPYGCLFVVDQITRADQIYRELDALIPGKVAVWSSEHDPGCTERTKVPHPAATFTKDQLKDRPAAVVTHAFFRGKGSYKAREVLHQGHTVPRALTVVDERIEEVTVYDVELSAAQHVRELVQRDENAVAHVGPRMDALVDFMHQRSLVVGGGSLEKPTTDREAWSKAERELQWFPTSAATAYAKTLGTDSSALPVFGFAKAVAEGYAYITRNKGDGSRYIGYKYNLEIASGTVLLDATSDIDGVSLLCPWREHQEVPRARYDNLQIVHVPAPPTIRKKRLSQHLKSLKNRKEYVDWMVSTIVEQVRPGQRALVVCKKTLFDNENVPAWPLGDPRHGDHDLYTKNWGWDVDGRKLCAIHWGTGIGENTWNEADVVLLFDEFWLPRRTVIATTQGLRHHKATEGDLGNMGAMNSKAPAVDIIEEGHRLRWTKQMALRGRGRSYDAKGVCGHQKLVCSGDFKKLLAHSEALFPGAQIQIVSPEDGGKQTQADAFLAILSRPKLPPKLTTQWIGQQMKRPWRDVSKHVLKQEAVLKAIENLGWTYVPNRGCKGACFVRRQDEAVETRTESNHEGASPMSLLGRGPADHELGEIFRRALIGQPM
jgi:hypothetical protein